jgi:hypothetical protein
METSPSQREMDRKERESRPSRALPASLPPRVLSRVAAAAYVGVSASFFDTMVRRQLMPRPARCSRRLLWDRHQIDRALDAIFNEEESGDDAPEFAV